MSSCQRTKEQQDYSLHKKKYVNLYFPQRNEWHGASWNFILWGLYFGFLILMEKWFLFGLLSRLPRFIGHIYILLAVIIGWALFEFEQISHRLHIGVRCLVSEDKGFTMSPPSMICPRMLYCCLFFPCVQHRFPRRRYYFSGKSRGWQGPSLYVAFIL